MRHACAFLAQKALAPESLPWPARVRVRFAVLSARVRIRALLRETFGRAASTGQKADCGAAPTPRGRPSFSKPAVSASPRPRGAGAGDGTQLSKSQGTTNQPHIGRALLIYSNMDHFFQTRALVDRRLAEG